MKALVPLAPDSHSSIVMPAVRRLVELVPTIELHFVSVLGPKAARATSDHPVAANTPASMASTVGPVVAAPLPRTVESHGEAMERLEGECRERLQATANELGAPSSVLHVAWSEHPAAAIVSLANELNADLIAMATHGRTGLSRVLIGSVTEAVLRTSGLPFSPWDPASRRAPEHS